MKRGKPGKHRPGNVRIIGGKWRGRRLPVPDLDGLRPSGDRSRETLFNWLQPFLHGKRCLDLFAGTGALGIEAVSRGASRALLIEKSPLAAASINKSIELLKTDQVQLVINDAQSWLLGQQGHSFDLVMLDPPFKHGIQEEILKQLESMEMLVSGGLVYLESAVSDPEIVIGQAWKYLKQKRLGDVRMLLIEKK